MNPNPGGTGRIAGWVKTQSGSPISEAAVAIVDGTAPFPDIAALTDDEGKYELSDIPAGTFEVAVHTEEYSAQNPVTIRGGETSRLDFIIPPEEEEM